MLSPFPAQECCARSSARGPARHPLRPLLQLLAGVGLGAVLLGCSPALDWRQAGPEHVDLLMDFPCKPQNLSQPVLLAGKRLQMTMTGCEAAHMTFALAHADVGEPALVAPALAELHRAALGNISARVLAQRAASVHHADAGLGEAVELDLAGQAPRGAGLREHVLLFAQGTQVFQATVLARDRDYKEDAARTFAGSVQLGAPPVHAPRAASGAGTAHD